MEGQVGAEAQSGPVALDYAQTPDMSISGKTAINITGTLSNVNYAITYVSGTLTVSKQSSSDGGSSSGGGSHSGGGSNSGSTATAEAIGDAEKAVVESTDMGTWLPLAFKDGYSIEKVTSVTDDGTDVTAKQSKVTTDGAIAKLPQEGTPKQVGIKSGD